VTPYTTYLYKLALIFYLILPFNSQISMTHRTLNLEEMNICPHRKLCKTIYNSSNHNSSKLEATQISVTWKMGMPNVVLPENRIGFFNKMMMYWYLLEHCWTLILLGEMKDTKHKIPNIAWFHLDKISSKRKSPARKQIVVCIWLGTDTYNKQQNR
jgi:hypothetical protein